MIYLLILKFRLKLVDYNEEITFLSKKKSF